MLIGELTRKTGLSKDTVRFYEKMGLFKLPAKARRQNRYKEYPESVANKLIVIQKLKTFGFTLTEIGDMVSLYEDDLLVCSDNIPLIKDKIKAIEEKLKDLNAIREQLLNCVNNCPGNCAVERTLLDLKSQPNN